MSTESETGVIDNALMNGGSDHGMKITLQTSLYCNVKCLQDISGIVFVEFAAGSRVS